MSGISAHVLDTTLGRPATGLRVRLSRRDESGEYLPLTSTSTDDDGRIRDLLPGRSLEIGTYKINFETGPYLQATHQSAFFPEVAITFTVTAPDEHHHVPLLLNPFGYTTYRGS
jgi:5-hydroxyisourate hydrolase